MIHILPCHIGVSNVRVGKRKRCQPAMMIERKYSPGQVDQVRILQARTWQLLQQLVVCPGLWVISPCHWFLAGCIGRAWKFRTRVNYFRTFNDCREKMVQLWQVPGEKGGVTLQKVATPYKLKKGAWWEADVASQTEDILASSPPRQAPSSPSSSPTSTFFATIITFLNFLTLGGFGQKIPPPLLKFENTRLHRWINCHVLAPVTHGDFLARQGFVYVNCTPY